ncbi:beta-lactamase-like protein [Xylariaceae sp. FL0255]|nr:beta-lactamase-like protein [Xylariaceae sp. FL0255]
MKRLENVIAQVSKHSSNNYKIRHLRLNDTPLTSNNNNNNICAVRPLHFDNPRNVARPNNTRFSHPVISNFALRMLNYVQILTTPTADTNGTAILLHFDNQRYVFGNIAEGLQRASTQRKLSLGKIEDFFIAGPMNWRNAGGLLGMILTIADVHSEAKKAQAREGNRISVPTKINVHGGKNLCHLLATSRRFIFRQGFPLRPLEIRDDPRAGDKKTSEPDFKDNNINVWYMPIEPHQQSKAETPSPRKRTHDEFRESPAAESSDESHKFAETVVKEMFDSDWTPDALYETTLHQAALPAKIFVRNEKGHLKVYDGPLPGGDVEVPDIPVRLRRPWPGATIDTLPPNTPSLSSMCYLVKSHDRRGRFDPKAAEALGIAKKDYKILSAGESLPGKDGVIVTPDMVLGKSLPGSGFGVVDLPDATYVETLINRPEFTDTQIMKGVCVIFWLLGPDVVKDPRLQTFMQKHSSIKHIVSSADNCPNMIALESPATQAFKLRCIDADRFPLPHHDNQLSLLGKPIENVSSEYEGARSGKTIQFAPRYLEKDDKILPFPNIEKLARENLNEVVLKLAAQARSDISDPEFSATVEKAESDIPNRDAEIITLGTGSALPSKYRNVSATLVRVPGYGNYLLDAGENTIGQMRRVFGDELPSVLRDLKAIWISHLHADHHLGTVSIIKAWHEETKEINPSAKLLMASHAHMIDWLKEYADVEDYGFERLETIRYGTATEPCLSAEQTQQFGLARIDAVFVVHCFGALAVALTFPSGLKIAYSGDCRPSDKFVEIGQGATVLIHESTFDDEMKGDAIAKKHSTMSEAIDVGRRMGARRIVLTHFSQRYQKLPIMEENFKVQEPEVNDNDVAKKVDEVILVAFDCMRVKIGDFRKAQAFLPAVQKLLEDEK